MVQSSNAVTQGSMLLIPQRHRFIRRVYNAEAVAAFLARFPYRGRIRRPEIALLWPIIRYWSLVLIFSVNSRNIFSSLIKYTSRQRVRCIYAWFQWTICPHARHKVPPPTLYTPPWTILGGVYRLRPKRIEAVVVMLFYWKEEKGLDSVYNCLSLQGILNQYLTCVRGRGKKEREEERINSHPPAEIAGMVLEAIRGPCFD